MVRQCKYDAWIKSFFLIPKGVAKRKQKEKEFPLRGISYLFVEVGEPIRATKSLKKKKQEKN